MSTPASTAPKADQPAGTFTLPPLPFGDDTLAPVISANTLSFHHGKHHKAYVDNLNKLIPGSPFAGKSLEDVVRASAGQNPGVFNNAAQIWNHSFYWHGLKGGGLRPSGELAAAIDRDLGGLDKFKQDFAAAGNTQFGSGWAWLVAEKGKLAIVKTANAETPLTRAGAVPLLTIDVWEHAYYLDYQNRRPDHTAAVVDKLLNWDFAAEQFAKAGK